jgi:exodeoxyribonuclease I
MTFYFYDLETSGINARNQRIMQFAGQRTDMDLKPVGAPDNFLVKFPDDMVPEPQAVLITGITPQQTLAEGISEAEFLQIFIDHIATKDTIMMGYNTVRFDDEFMRFALYRNFYDPYEWQWADGRSRWDLLDVIRMTRALRPGDIKWPVDMRGNPTNRLELLTAMNGLDHSSAHDALNDVQATISLAALIKSKQPKLFDFLLNIRTKQAVAKLVTAGQPFIYTSGKYDAAYEKTTIVATIAELPKGQGALVYDLRHDPMQFEAMSPEELVEAWRRRYDDQGVRLPIKTMKYNRVPAIAPIGVLDAESKERLKIDMNEIKANLQTLKSMKDWLPKVLQALDILEKQQDTKFAKEVKPVDEQLYDGFIGDEDKRAMSQVRAAKPADLSSLQLHFRDQRLTELLPLYKARNYPELLTSEERDAWETHRTEALLSGKEKSRIAQFIAQITDIQTKGGLTDNEEYLLQELQLYAESIMPEV